MLALPFALNWFVAGAGRLNGMHMQPVKRIHVVDDQLMATELEAIFGAGAAVDDQLKSSLETAGNLFEVRSIVTGIVVGDSGDEYVIDAGYKSEGYVDKAEFGDDRRRYR